MLLLRQTYPESNVAERRVVARSAGDLADSGRYAADKGVELTPQHIVDQLADAPDEHPQGGSPTERERVGLVERWNWWMGALDTAHGGYDRFTVRAWHEDEA